MKMFSLRVSPYVDSMYETKISEISSALFLRAELCEQIVSESEHSFGLTGDIQESLDRRTEVDSRQFLC